MKKAFTIIEMLISITIFTLILTYLHQAIDYSKNKNQILESNFNEFSKSEKIKFLIYNDIFNQIDLSKDRNITDTNDKKMNILFFRTHNSIHSILMPYVAYFVEDEILFRIESKDRITLPVKYENIKNYKIDKIYEDVEQFNVYENKNSLLFYINTKNKQKFFEIDLPISPKNIDINETNDDVNKTKDDEKDDVNKTKDDEKDDENKTKDDEKDDKQMNNDDNKT